MLFQDLGLLILLVRRVLAEVPDPEKDLVEIGRAQSVVVGNYFYTVGGYTTFNVPDGFPFGIKREGVTTVTASNGHLRRIDLTRSFNVSEVNTVQEESIPLSGQVARMRSGSTWAHNTTIYLWPSNSEKFPRQDNGIWTNVTERVSITRRAIWTYDTANPDAGWGTIAYLGSTNIFSLVAGGSVAYLDGIAYVLGWTYNSTTTPPISGNKTTEKTVGEELLEYKLDSLFMLDMEKVVVRIETSSIVNSGKMVAIKNVGKSGILVHIGGGGSDEFNDMSPVQVYDIASSTWNTQRATTKDEVPPRRRKDFCAVAMSAQDHSSHQIYFYGGYPDDRRSRRPLNDLWVLTLPSFQFIKVGNSLEAARASGTCGIISPQYLLVYRGDFYDHSERYDELQGKSLALLDLTDLEWKTEYTPTNASTVYRVPQKVIEVIGGDEAGNATTTAPIRGFEDESLATVFNFSDSTKPPSYSSHLPSLSPSAGTDLTPESPYTAPPNYRVVIGVSIACTAVALLSIAGITLLFRNRQRNKLRALAEELGPKPWERREADGNAIVPVDCAENYELEGSTPAVHEIGGGPEGGGEGEWKAEGL